MNKFYIKNGHFWLNDQPQLIQAGEFHYYRTPKDQWPHRLNLLKAAGFNALATYIPWLWHQVEQGVTDLDGHSHSMRDLAGFLDLAAELGFFIIARPGPYIMAETINEGIPPWVFRLYPQCAYISQDGVTQNIASYLHPDFLLCVKQWYAEVFKILTPRQITHGGRIIMIQLDNEMGMLQWVRNIMDLNLDTLNRFADYLRTTQTGHFSHLSQHDELVTVIREALSRPQPSSTAWVVEAYRRFYRHYLREYTTFLWKEAMANGMNVLPVINIHGFGNGGKTFPIGLSQLIEAMRIHGMVSATDVYPIFIGEGNFHQLLLVNEMTKALHNKEQALFSIEFQAGGNNDFSGSQASMYELHTRLCLSSGMKAINHYLFCDGENDPILSPTKRHDWGHPVRKDGTVRKHYHRYGRVSQVLKTYGPDLIYAQPEPVTTVGFHLDMYMTEVQNAATREAANIITHQRDVILFDFIARGLALTHRAFKVAELSLTNLDGSLESGLWVMMDQECDAATQQKLVNYAAQGGHLTLVGRMCIRDFTHSSCTILKDALGVTELETDTPFTATRINAFEHHDIPASFVESYKGEFDDVFATRTDGQVVGFVRQLGRGQVMMLGAALAANTLDDLNILQQMALKMGCPAPFTLDDWVDVRLSRGKHGSFLFVNNYQDDPVQTTIQYQGRDLFGGHVIALPARSGAILPLDWNINEHITVNFLTAEITDISVTDTTIILHTAQKEFFAELTLDGFDCQGAALLGIVAGARRVKVQGLAGTLTLLKNQSAPSHS